MTTDAAVVDLRRLLGAGAPTGTCGRGPAEDPAAWRMEGHLPECRHPGRPLSECDWCLGTVADSDLRRLTDLVSDARSLIEDHDRRKGDVSVPWVVAAGDLRSEVLDDTQVRLAVPSVAELQERVHRLAVRTVGHLGRRVEGAVVAGGPLERRCLLGAGLLAADALQRHDLRTARSRMPRPIRATLDDLSGLLSDEVRTAGLLPLVEQCHWDGLPTLRTQPVWRRRPAAPPASASRPDRPGAPRPGSIEALVREAAVAEIEERITGILPALTAAAPPVHVERAHRIPRADRARALTLRMGRVDWTATFLDSGLSRCWPSEDGRVLVPWTVALALEESDRHGLMSVTHTDPAEPRRRT